MPHYAHHGRCEAAEGAICTCPCGGSKHGAAKRRRRRSASIQQNDKYKALDQAIKQRFTQLLK